MGVRSAGESIGYILGDFFAGYQVEIIYRTGLTGLCQWLSSSREGINRGVSIRMRGGNNHPKNNEGKSYVGLERKAEDVLLRDMPIPATARLYGSFYRLVTPRVSEWRLLALKSVEREED